MFLKAKQREVTAYVYFINLSKIKDVAKYLEIECCSDNTFIIPRALSAFGKREARLGTYIVKYSDGRYNILTEEEFNILIEK